MSDYSNVERIIAAETECLRPNWREFFKRIERGDDGTAEWAYYAHGYSGAFESLAEEALKLWPRREYLFLPLCFLCRHSVELHFKSTLRDMQRVNVVDEIPTGHNLLELWRALIGSLQTYFDQPDDELVSYCDRAVGLIHSFDPGGDRFRYPEDKKGREFHFVQTEIEELVKAHWWITVFCDGTSTMIAESNA